MAREAVGQEALDSIGTKVSEIHRSAALPGEKNLRISVASSRGEPTIVVQLSVACILNVEQARVPKPILEAVLKMRGLVIFTGLAGSGKSTTAYTVLDYVNSEVPCHICTVEDPIYAHLNPKKALVQQREIGLDVRDSLSGIRAAMVQDLDVLFLSEIKTLEEIEACLATAELGHLVITVFHAAASPQELIRRIVEAFPEEQRAPVRRTLANVLTLVCAQKLLPHVKSGRVPAYSYIIPDGDMRRAIQEGEELLPPETSTHAGCQTMAQTVQDLLDKEWITEETARQAISGIG